MTEGRTKAYSYEGSRYTRELSEAAQPRDAVLNTYLGAVALPHYITWRTMHGMPENPFLPGVSPSLWRPSPEVFLLADASYMDASFALPRVHIVGKALALCGFLPGAER